MGIAAFGQAAAIDRQLGFSREAEQEADRNGLEMLRKAGYDPNGMAAMFGRLSRASSLNEGRGGGVYASTHPLSSVFCRRWIPVLCARRRNNLRTRLELPRSARVRHRRLRVALRLGTACRSQHLRGRTLQRPPRHSRKRSL
jgi:predicted Zn-dependent protease